MTAKMTDEAVKRQWGYCGKPRQWQDGFDAGMREYLPQIQQLQVENESLHATLEKYVKEHARLQEEIDKLKKDLERTGYIDFEVTRGYWHVERVKLISNIAQLTAKHEKLVKWLKENDSHFVETNEVLEKLTGEEVKG